MKWRVYLTCVKSKIWEENGWGIQRIGHASKYSEIEQTTLDVDGGKSCFHGLLGHPGLIIVWQGYWTHQITHTNHKQKNEPENPHRPTKTKAFQSLIPPSKLNYKPNNGKQILHHDRNHSTGNCRSYGHISERTSSLLLEPVRKDGVIACKKSTTANLVTQKINSYTTKLVL